MEGGEDPLPDGRVCRDGGGRKSAEKLDRLLVPALPALVEPDERAIRCRRCGGRPSRCGLWPGS